MQCELLFSNWLVSLATHSYGLNLAGLQL